MKMEFPGEVVASIIEQRTALNTSLPKPSKEHGRVKETLELAIRQATHMVGFGIAVSVTIGITHENCGKEDPLDCDDAFLFEVWTLRKVREQAVNSMLMNSMMFKQALRSQLHFSPISSYLAQSDQKLPHGLKVAYRVATASNGTQSLFKHVGHIETHLFPFCKYENDQDPNVYEYLSVEVQWLRFKQFPKINLHCQGDSEWVLPKLDGIRSITDEDEEGTSTSFSSSSFPPSPPNEPVSPLLPVNSHSGSRFTEAINSCIDDSGFDDRSPRRRTRKRNPAGRHNDPIDDDDELLKSDQRRSPRLRHYHRTRRSTASSATENPFEEDKPLLRARASSAFCASALTSTKFHPKTRLPLNSSPAPINRTPLNLVAQLRNKFSNIDGDSSSSDSEYVAHKNSSIYGSNHSNNALLCNFEESALNGRLEPAATIDGFRLQLCVSGSFSVPHTVLPVTTYFFDVSDDNAPSLYLGHCNFKNSPFARKAVHIPKKCIVQATLFNPQGSVVRIFIVKIDVSDIPPRSRTFIRQRTFVASESSPNLIASNAGENNGSEVNNFTGDSRSTANRHPLHRQEQRQQKHLRYLIHFRLATDKAGKLYMHTDIRLLFSNNYTDLDLLNLVAERGPLPSPSPSTLSSSVAPSSCASPPQAPCVPLPYELMTATEMPQKPKYSPIK